MPLATNVTSTIKLIDPDYFQARITKFEPVVGQFGPQWLADFTIIAPGDEESDGAVITKWLNRAIDEKTGEETISQKSELYPLVCALAAEDLAAGTQFAVEPETVLDRIVTINVTNVKGKDGVTRNKIKEIGPQRKPKKRQPVDD